MSMSDTTPRKRTTGADGSRAEEFCFWGPFRMRLEGDLFRRLRDVLATAPFDAAAADALRDGLVGLAAERGQKEAEMFAAVAGGLSPDYVASTPDLERRRRELLDDPYEGRYFALVAKSCRIVWRDHHERIVKAENMRFYRSFDPMPRRINHDLLEWMRVKRSLEAEMMSSFLLAALPVLTAAGLVPEDGPEMVVVAP